MTDPQIKNFITTLQEKIKLLTSEIDMLQLQALDANKKAKILAELTKAVAQDANTESQANENLALLAYIAAKSSHMAARSKNDIDWIMLAEKADAAAKDVYDFAVKQQKVNEAKANYG